MGKSRRATQHDDDSPVSHNALILELDKLKSELKSDLIQIVSNVVNKHIRMLEDRVDQQESEISALKQIILDNEREKLKVTRSELVRNFVIRGLDEPKEEKKTELDDKVKDVMNTLDVKFNPISIQRVGKRVDGKPRTIKVVTQSVDDRNAVLKRSRQLRQNSSFKQVYLDSDKCFLDRREDARLRKQLRQWKQQNPTATVKIFRGKLLVDDVEVDHADPVKHIFSHQ